MNNMFKSYRTPKSAKWGNFLTLNPFFKAHFQKLVAAVSFKQGKSSLCGGCLSGMQTQPFVFHKLRVFKGIPQNTLFNGIRGIKEMGYLQPVQH